MKGGGKIWIFKYTQLRQELIYYVFSHHNLSGDTFSIILYNISWPPTSITECSET